MGELPKDVRDSLPALGETLEALDEVGDDTQENQDAMQAMAAAGGSSGFGVEEDDAVAEAREAAKQRVGDILRAAHVETLPKPPSGF